MRILMPHCRTNIHKYITVNLLNQCKYQLFTNIHKYITVNLLNQCKYQLFSCMFEYSGIFNLFIL